MDLNENRPAMASGIRPPARTGLPVPLSKTGLNEMTESQNNSRIAPPQPVSNMLKHKTSEIMEPPAKLRKTAENPSSFKRPASAQAMARPALASGQQLRPPSRLMNGTTQSSTSRFASSTSAYKTNSTQNSYNKSLSQSSNQLPRGHSRSKSHVAGYRQLNSDQDQHGKAQQQASNGMVPFSISTFYQSVLKSASRHVSLGVSSKSDPTHKYHVCTRSCSAPADLPTSSMAYILEREDESPEDSSLTSALQERLVIRGDRSSMPHQERCKSTQEPYISNSANHVSLQPKFCGSSKRDGVTRKLKLPLSSPVKTPKSGLPLSKPSQTMARRKSPKKGPGPITSPTKPLFLSKESNLTHPDWNDTGMESRIKMMETMFHALKGQMEGTSFERSSTKELIETMKMRILELDALKEKSDNTLSSLRSERDNLNLKSTQLEFEMEKLRRTHETDQEDMQRKHKYQIDDLLEQHHREIERLTRDANDNEESARKELQEEIDSLRHRYEFENNDLEKRLKQELEDEKDQRRKEVDDLRRQRDEQIEQIATTIGKKEREADDIRHELSQKAVEIERERTLRARLEAKLEQKSIEYLKLDDLNRDLRGKINFLASDNQQQSQAFTSLHEEAKAAIAEKDDILRKLRAEESLRRKLHNEIQELKGNIRVFCRVRPVLQDEGEAARINFPDDELDGREVMVTGPDQKSSLGKDITKHHPFAFDRVFGPRWSNSEIFDEVSQLVQSALDGYNCCIFSYGQTGTGKTYLMSSKDGMIPLAVDQIYQRTKELEERGWTYSMQGSFVEVYNENLNDLLGRDQDIDNKKLKIHHDDRTMKTTITDVSIVPLDSPEAVHNVLTQADRYRSVAATKANQRSSRSHSVFILSLVGENPITGERCEGTLNLVDLAGSERLAHSKAEGDRLKETQNINKSLSSLGDVIAALGKADPKAHIPYSNSTLTKLLRFSLGGNSKTLMFVMISPLQAHLDQTLTSLRFATKVHSTHIGTAKRQVQTKD